LFEQSVRPDSVMYNVGRFEAALMQAAAHHVPLSWTYGATRRPLAPSEATEVVTRLDPVSLDHNLSFASLHAAPHSLATGAYGAVGSQEALAVLEAIATFDALEAREASLDPPSMRAESDEFLVAFFDHANRRRNPWWEALAPPSHFWTSREGPRYDFGEPLTRLDVILVSAIHRDRTSAIQRRLVLSVEAGPDGSGVVVSHPPPAGDDGESGDTSCLVSPISVVGCG
jgi:hypothetical protein